MKKFIVILAIIVSVISCKKSEKKEAISKFDQAAWLEGSWEYNSPEGNLNEIWTKENDSVLHGKAYFIEGKDTLHNESIVLQQVGEELIYSPTVKGQNNERATDFKLMLASDTQLSFENTAHDYPQKIVYRKVTNDSLITEISGIQQGKPSSEKFHMTRKK